MAVRFEVVVLNGGWGLETGDCSLAPSPQPLILPGLSGLREAENLVIKEVKKMSLEINILENSFLKGIYIDGEKRGENAAQFVSCAVSSKSVSASCPNGRWNKWKRPTARCSNDGPQKC